MQRALITGITGQDGAYLSRLLLDKGYEIFGSTRQLATADLQRLRAVGTARDVQLLECDLLTAAGARQLITQARPDEVYNLMAQSFPAASLADPLQTAEVNGTAVLRLLEAVRALSPTARFFQASSSDMFGAAEVSPQNEGVAFRPRNPYAAAKLFAHWITVVYRQIYGVFTCCGILFNHESPLRDPRFVTRKITDAVARIKQGTLDRLVLGNLQAQRDWGYAPEYVEAMWRMLQCDTPDDFVIATGEGHTVREFVDAAFQTAGIAVTWRGTGLAEQAVDRASDRVVVEVSAELFRPVEHMPLIGDPTKARERLRWTPQTRFHDLVRIMMTHDLAGTGETSG